MSAKEAWQATKKRALKQIERSAADDAIAAFSIAMSAPDYEEDFEASLAASMMFDKMHELYMNWYEEMSERYS